MYVCGHHITHTVTGPGELDALRDLFHATQGDAWLINSGWLSAADPCEGGWAQGYHGIICNEGKTSVSELWLGSNKLIGMPPPSLTELKGLRFIDLGNNGLSGFLDNSLSALLSHDNIEMRFWNNRILCPVPLALLPAVGACVDAGMSLLAIAPSSALAFEATEVVLSGNLRGGAHTLAAYPELRVRALMPNGDSLYIAAETAAGPDSLRVTLPAVSGAMEVVLTLEHGGEQVASGEARFRYEVCAAGFFKSIDDQTLQLRCEECPVNYYCIENKKVACSATTHAPERGSTSCQPLDNGSTLLAVTVVLSALFGLLVVGALAFGLRKFVLHYRVALRAKQQQREANLARLRDATLSMSTVRFSVCLVKFSHFKSHGRLIPHEEVRQRGQLISLDEHEHVLAFAARYHTMFVSHQWLGYDHPDPEVIHYPAIVEAANALCAKFSLDPDSLYLWIDYLSIPQRNPILKELSISSLGVYSSFVEFFVVVAPSCVHYNTREPCDATSYQQRGWVRLEQWARMTVGGLRNMFIFDDNKNLVAIEKRREWYLDSIHVFKAHFTDPSDKPKLVDTGIGLWAYTLKNHGVNNACSTAVYEAIQQSKATVFPKEYFGENENDLIALLEQNLELVTSGSRGPSPPTPRQQATSSTHAPLPEELMHLDRSVKASPSREA